jgi:hypothetical protein
LAERVVYTHAKLCLKFGTDTHNLLKHEVKLIIKTDCANPGKYSNFSRQSLERGYHLTAGLMKQGVQALRATPCNGAPGLLLT